MELQGFQRAGLPRQWLLSRSNFGSKVGTEVTMIPPASVEEERAYECISVVDAVQTLAAKKKRFKVAFVWEN